MPNPNSATRLSRTKIYLPLRTGDPVGRSLREWAYMTPRFPKGIKGSNLLSASLEVQRETMIVWFLANHVPAEGKFFGFAGAAPIRALNTSPLNTTPFNGGIEIVGFDQGPFFTGGTPIDLLKAEFKEFVQEPALLEVAGLFEGLWQSLPGDTYHDIEKQTHEDRVASLVAALDDFSHAVRKLPPEHGGIGHNRPPEDVPTITENEKEIVLRATAETRISVLSSDYPAASLAWEAISPIVQRIGNGVAKQVENLCTKFTNTLGATGALIAAGYITHALGIWTKAEAISAMLELAKHLGP